MEKKKTLPVEVYDVLQSMVHPLCCNCMNYEPPDLCEPCRVRKILKTYQREKN